MGTQDEARDFKVDAQCNTLCRVGINTGVYSFILCYSVKDKLWRQKTSGRQGLERKRNP